MQFTDKFFSPVMLISNLHLLSLKVWETISACFACPRLDLKKLQFQSWLHIALLLQWSLGKRNNYPRALRDGAGTMCECLGGAIGLAQLPLFCWMYLAASEGNTFCGFRSCDSLFSEDANQSRTSLCSESLFKPMCKVKTVRFFSPLFTNAALPDAFANILFLSTREVLTESAQSTVWSPETCL